VSRRHDARRKAKRREARAAAESVPKKRRARPRRLVALVPVLVIAAILGIGVLAFGTKKQPEQEVTALLAGIPQKGVALGSPRAPITVQMFADLECPTVKLFAESYLPSILDKWVRTGIVQLKYRPLQTDTKNEEIFFRHEIAALAAGRQDKMWNFLLTFLHEQGERFTDYADDDFLTDIASQVPGLERIEWRRDREAASLGRQVALSVHFGHARSATSTPSFLVGVTGESGNGAGGHSNRSSLRSEVETSLKGQVESLDEEALRDIPTVGPFGSTAARD
jgi:protein-disulfide isomerase